MIRSSSKPSGLATLLACTFAASCVDTSDPLFTNVWDSQGSGTLQVQFNISGGPSLIAISWYAAGVYPLPATWRLLEGPCGAAPSAFTKVAEGAWDYHGEASESNVTAGICRGYRLLGISATGTLTAPSAEKTFTPECRPGEHVCGGACVTDPNTDSHHCGAACLDCATTVGTGAFCQAGTCQCPSNQTACGGACVSTSNDATHCGASCANCATTVGVGAFCNSGTCECPGAYLVCGGTCANTVSDPSHCGSSCANCATTVGAGAICNAGVCGCAGTATVVCGGICADPSSDANHCGASCANCASTVGTGAICHAGVCGCAPGTQLQSGTCITTDWAEWPLPPEPPASSYQVGTGSAVGVVFDTVTGLVWQQTVPSGGYTQSAAANYCATLSLDPSWIPVGGWRLPSYVELYSIVDHTQAQPSIDATAFPGAPSSEFWTSSPVAYPPSSGDGWLVDFINGYSIYTETTLNFSVRCVH